MAQMEIIGTRAHIEGAIPPELKEFFKVEVKGGDTKIIWNPRDRDEAKNAESMFKELRKKRFLAFKVTEEGNKGEQIDRWDPEVGKMIFVPQMAGG